MNFSISLGFDNIINSKTKGLRKKDQLVQKIYIFQETVYILR